MAKAPMYEPLTEAQIEVLNAFKAQNGRNWKSKLSAMWANATASPMLHRLRNTHGPLWLKSYKLKRTINIKQVNHYVWRHQS